MVTSEQSARFDSRLTLPDESKTAVRDGLERVFKISSWLDFPFTLDEVAEYFLPGLDLTPDQLRNLFTNSVTDLPFTLRDGFLLTGSTQSTVSRTERKLISAAKLDSASRFTTILTRLVPWIETVAVTGSVAYGSARKLDDIDLFMVTRRNRLWISLFVALILVRLGKLLHLRESHLLSFCLSYAHDELGFLQESSKSKLAPLFARELLKARPLTGVQKYREILEDNDWVQSFHRVAYHSKLRSLRERGQSEKYHPEQERFSIFLDWANSIAFVFLSTYLKIRGYLTNVKLRSEGLEFRVFETVMSRWSCMYVSNLYRWLHQLWSGELEQAGTRGMLWEREV